MKKAYLLIAVAYLVHATAWFLPVEKHGVTLPVGVPGWQAFRIAACMVWPYEGSRIDGWYNVVLSTTSAATTVLFVLGLGLVIRVRSRRLSRVSAGIAACAFIVNAHWVLRFGSDRFDLRIGYFLWWASFLLLAIGLFRLSHDMGSIDPALGRRRRSSTKPYRNKYKCLYGHKNCGENAVYCEPCNKRYDKFLLLLNDDR